MKYPIPIKQIPNSAVPKYPRLKSNIEFLIEFCCFLLFSTVHKEFQIETSSGAGIHPIKAIKKITSEFLTGNTCWNFIGSPNSNPAKKNDKIVLKDKAIIKYLINLSKALNFPSDNNVNDRIVIMTVQISIENRPPKIELAIPAVTIVMAVWMVNIVVNDRKKKM